VIIPLTSDTEWQVEFAELPPFTLPFGPVLIVAPHPDDETLGTGALIATLRSHAVPVTVVAVTDGENAYDSVAIERIALGTTRDGEQQDALALLGVQADSIKRLRLTDSGLAAQEGELTIRLAELVKSGMTILAPWEGDFHPDHEACARASATVARTMGLRLVSYFFWTWHRGVPDLLKGLPLFRFDPDPAALAAKAQALMKYRSQLEHGSGEPILPDRLLAPARWRYEVFLNP
jgi:LmbE family N-acetylglucosaminyl deacetylase